MSVEAIKQLIEQIDKTDYKYVNIHTSDFDLVLSKRDNDGGTVQTLQENNKLVNDYTAQQTNVSSFVSVESTQQTVQENSVAVEEGTFKTVDSPIVGIVYLAPGPEEAPFVKVGDFIEKGQVICIVEAMKIMNEIKSDVSGYVSEILVQNESVVEYGQPFIKVKEA